MDDTSGAIERRRSVNNHAILHSLRTRDEAIVDLFDYIEIFYNRSLFHSTPGSKSPIQFLQDRIMTQHERNRAA